MRNFLLAAVAAVALYGAGSGGVLGQHSNDEENRWMRVDNISGLTAWRAYIIPSGKDCCWSRDIFDIYVVPKKNKKGRGTAEESKGPFYFFNFDDGSGNCVFDVRIVGERLFEWNFDKLDVCQTAAITLKPVGTEPSKDNYGRRMRVVNESKFKATEIWIIQSGEDCCWLPIPISEKKPTAEKESISKKKPISEKEKELGVFNFDDGSGACEFDVLVREERKKEEGDRINWFFDKINVCSEDKAAKKTITLIGAPVPRDPKKSYQMVVKNDSNFKVERIKIIRSGEPCCWSSNLLEFKIREGQSRPVDFFDDSSGACVVDIHITGQHREWILDRVNVCGNPDKDDKATITLK